MGEWIGWDPSPRHTFIQTVLVFSSMNTEKLGEFLSGCCFITLANCDFLAHCGIKSLVSSFVSRAWLPLSHHRRHTSNALSPVLPYTPFPPLLVAEPPAEIFPLFEERFGQRQEALEKGITLKVKSQTEGILQKAGQVLTHLVS